MKVLIDVNLAPAWAPFLAGNRIEAVHWTTVGDSRAADEELLRYARENGFVVFTHDLDFGTLLALTRALGPSVLQVRAQNVLPEAIGGLVVRVSDGACHRVRGGCARHSGRAPGANTHLADSVTASRNTVMLSTLLSIRGPAGVTSWTRAKRLGGRFLDGFSSTRSRSNDS